MVLLRLFAPGCAQAADPILPQGWEQSDIDPQSGLNVAERRMLQDALLWVGTFVGHGMASSRAPSRRRCGPGGVRLVCRRRAG